MGVLIVATKKTKSVTTKNKIDMSKLLKLYFFEGKNETECGKILGVAKQSVNSRLAPFKKLLKDPETINTYRDNKGDILQSIEMVLAENLVDKDKLKAASLNNVAYAFQQIFNASRLEQGKSTENIAVQNITLEERERLEGLARKVSQEEIKKIQDSIEAGD